MTRRWSIVILGLVLLAATVALARPVWEWFGPPPELYPAVKHLAAGRFDAAEAQIDRYLAVYPDSAEAHFLMAQVLMERPDPKHARALEHLGKIRGDDPQLIASVRVSEGKALYRLGRMAQAERAWSEALRLDPLAAEAGWLLLQLYYLQGREADSRRLVLKLHPIEPDPGDRARYLLELTKQDVERLAAAGIIQWLEPAVRNDPDDRHSALAYGRALAREGRAEEGLTHLRRLVDQQPDDPAAWDALLDGLGAAGDPKALAEAFDRLPPALASRPWAEAHRGRIALDRLDYPAAVRAYEAALAGRPDDPKLHYQLARALRYAGRVDEATLHEEREKAYKVALDELRELFRQAEALPNLGQVPQPRLYQRLADLREGMGRVDEAVAWHRLVLQDSPDDATSCAAVERLEGRTRTESGDSS